LHPLVNLSKHSHYGPVVLVIIPLALSSFTHLWNPLGFPAGTSYDEGIYLRRAMHLLNGLGPQENQKFYDHPYFSQLFIAAFFWSIGYPVSTNPSSEDIDSIETLYMIPRLLTGTLAVFDTFLIYLIAQRRYSSRNVAFAAAMLFAGMPLTSLLLRRVWLEPIQLPFILLSILFALWVQRSNINETRITGDDDDDYIKGIQSKDHGKSMTVTPGHFYKRRMRRRTRTRRNAFLLTIISGAFLGIAMFTKVPAFTFTPLLGFLIYNNNLGRKRKILFFLWLVPLLGIVMIWPVYAFSVGNIGEWTDGILWQTNREGRDLFYSLQYDLAIDPVLLILGGAGLIYAILRKDLFILFWIVPFFIFLYLIGFVSFWHLIPALPAFCIAIARMINEVTHSVIRRAFFKELLPLLVILGLVTAEIAYTAPSIISGSNQNIYSTVTILTDYLKKEDDRIKEESSEHKKTVTVIGDPSYLWIPQYVFKLDNFDYKTYSGDALDASNRAILIADQGLVRALSLDNETSKVLERMYSSNNTKTIITIGDNGPKSSQVSILSYDPLSLQIPS
jgi:hypothetical protein